MVCNLCDCTKRIGINLWIRHREKRKFIVPVKRFHLDHRSKSVHHRSVKDTGGGVLTTDICRSDKRYTPRHLNRRRVWHLINAKVTLVLIKNRHQNVPRVSVSTRQLVKKNDGVVILNCLDKQSLSHERTLVLAEMGITDKRGAGILCSAEVEVVEPPAIQHVCDSLCGESLTTTRRTSHHNVLTTKYRTHQISPLQRIHNQMRGLESFTVLQKLYHIIFQFIFHILYLLGGNRSLAESIVVCHISITPLRTTSLGVQHTECSTVCVGSLSGVERNINSHVITMLVNCREIIQNLYKSGHNSSESVVGRELHTL